MARHSKAATDSIDEQPLSPTSTAIYDPADVKHEADTAIVEPAPVNPSMLHEVQDDGAIIIKAKRGERISIVTGKRNAFMIGPALISIKKE